MKFRARIIPAFLLSLALVLTSCSGNYAFAQQPAPVITPGVYFSPQTDLEAIDVAVIEAAKAPGSINMAAYSLTDQKIIDALADRAAHGVTVRIYLDRGELQAQCRADATCARGPLHKLIGLAGVEIRVKQSKVLMHIKGYSSDVGGDQLMQFYIRDGSANFSEAGEKRQDNSLILTMDAHAGMAFGMKFRAMWARADNLTIAQALQ